MYAGYVLGGNNRPIKITAVTRLTLCLGRRKERKAGKGLESGEKTLDTLVKNLLTYLHQVRSPTLSWFFPPFSSGREPPDLPV